MKHKLHFWLTTACKTQKKKTELVYIDMVFGRDKN